MWTDPSFAKKVSHASQTALSGKLPIGPGVASGTPGTFSKIGNLEAKFQDTSLDLVSKRLSPGSSIFALEYKTVRRSLSSLVIGFL